MSDRRQMILGPMGRLPDGIARQMKQARFNPIRSCTPATLARDLDMFESGYLRQAALLWEAIEQRDDMVCPTALKRRSAVSARKFEVVMTEDSEEAEAHKAALEYCLNHLTITDALDLNVKGTFSDLVEQMMGSMLHRYAVHELIWQPGRRDKDGRPAVTAELKFCPLYLFENISGRLGYTGPLTSGSEGTPLSEDGWMITCGDGIMRAVSVAWMFKRLSLTDWLNFSEKFGIPGVHGTTNAVYGSEEWNNFVSALEKFANDWIMASAQGSDVKLIEVGKTGDAPFKPMVERMDRSIAILLLGSDLATLSRENGTGASLQGQSTEYLLARDCERMSSALQVNLGRKVIELLFGEGTEPLAYIQIPPPKQQDINQDMSVDKHLRALGVPMSVEDVLERYSRTLPDDDETLLQQPKQPRQAGMENERGDVQRQNVADALAEDLQPVREALATVLRAGDGDIDQALRELDAKWPDVLTAVMQGDALEGALESVLGEAFVAGLDLQELVEEAAFANANPYHDEKGRFTSKPGSGRSGNTKPNRDMFGERVSDQITDDQNFERGTNAINWALRNKKGVHEAMWVKGVGAIDLPWGTPGDRMADYQGGSGLSHILAKHGEKDVRMLPEVMLRGQVDPHPDHAHKKMVTHGNYLAILTQKPSGKGRWWVLTGFTERIR